MARTGDQDRASLIAEASEWLARLDVGRADVAELDAWRNADPRRAVAFAEVANAWNRLDVLRVAERRPERGISRRAWLAGAGASAAAGAAGFAWLGPDRLLRTRIVTAVGERRSLSLPDGSALELNTDTEVFWRFSREARKIWLSRGEAALNVAIDGARPFLMVTAQGLAQLAAGQFNVRLRTAGLDVMVLAGQASVQALSHHAQAEVTDMSAARQLLEVTATGIARAAAPQAEVEAAEAWRRGEIVFDGMALSDAVAEYNRYLARKLIVADDGIGRIRLGGRFLTNDPQNFLSALKSSFGIRIVEDDPSRILLKSG